MSAVHGHPSESSLHCTTSVGPSAPGPLDTPHRNRWAEAYRQATITMRERPPVLPDLARWGINIRLVPWMPPGEVLVVTEDVYEGLQWAFRREFPAGDAGYTIERV